MPGIQKNQQTGNFFVSYVPFVDRTKRRPFIKKPLVRSRNGLVGFFADLFRGGPNPFVASPIANAIDRKVKLEKQAKAAANSGNLAPAEALVTQIDAQLGQYLRAAAAEADRELDALDGFLEQEANCLKNCRPSEIQSRLEGELDNVLNDVNNEFGPLAMNGARKRQSLADFIEDNQLERSLHWGKPLTRQSIYLIIAITIFEFLLNTAFFSGTQRSGIIGGAALAMLLSITTLILGVAFGMAYQFANGRAEGRGWYGRVGIIVLALTTGYYLLLLTLARLAGEAGETRMFAAAAREIQVHPFSGLLDLPALAYLFFSIAVIAGVYRKFIDTMGHFPRIRYHKLAAERSESDAQQVRNGMLEAARSFVDEALKALDSAPGLIEATIIPIKELVMNYENVFDQFCDDVKDIEDASRLLVGVVKQYVPVDGARLTADYAAPVSAMQTRLQKFQEKAAALADWDEIKQSTIDRCRKAMIDLGTSKLKQIEDKCDEVEEERERELAVSAAHAPYRHHGHAFLAPQGAAE
jgi:hypothetical protein